MSCRKRILGLVAALVVLGLAGTLVLRALLAPAALEARVERAFLEATGLPLELARPPGLRLLPRLALDLGPGRAGAGPLVEWSALRIDASATSLLRGALELGRLEVDGLHLRLRRDAGGRGNWEPALQALLARSAQDGGGTVRIAAAALTNARIDYQDARDPDLALSLSGLALQAGAWAPGRPLALEGRFAVERAGRRLAVLSLASLRLVDAGDAGWRVESLALRGRALPQELPFDLAVPRLYIDPGRAVASAAAATLGVGPARLQASALRAGWHGSAPPQVSGAVSLEPVAPRELLTALALAVPRTRDPTALSRATAEAQLAWNGAALRIEPLRLSLDDTRLEGRVGWDGTLEFELRGDALDLDRYREPPEPAAEPFVFPGDAFAAWQARGTLALARARVEGVELEDVTLRLLLGPGATGGAAP
jgi:AsmA protein